MSAGAPGFGALSVVLTTTACVPGAIFYADFAIERSMIMRLYSKCHSCPSLKKTKGRGKRTSSGHERRAHVSCLRTPGAARKRGGIPPRRRASTYDTHPIFPFAARNRHHSEPNFYGAAHPSPRGGRQCPALYAGDVAHDLPGDVPYGGPEHHGVRDGDHCRKELPEPATPAPVRRGRRGGDGSGKVGVVLPTISPGEYGLTVCAEA
jgi:hypothetical protein